MFEGGTVRRASCSGSRLRHLSSRVWRQPVRKSTSVAHSPMEVVALLGSSSGATNRFDQPKRRSDGIPGSTSEASSFGTVAV